MTPLQVGQAEASAAAFLPKFDFRIDELEAAQRRHPERVRGRQSRKHQLAQAIEGRRRLLEPSAAAAAARAGFTADQHAGADAAREQSARHFAMFEHGAGRTCWRLR